VQPPVFLADRAALESDVVVLSGAEGRHAATVRRLRPGERADIADGAGLVAECVVAGPYPGGADGLELTVLARRQEPPPDPAITVVQALPKGDRGELAVEEMTEVGVDRIVPWAAARSITVWQGARGERALGKWRLTAREAAKQSRRAWIPEVTELAATADVARLAAKAACAIVLEPGAAVSLGRLSLPGSGDLLVVVGPEGGITAEELAAFQAAGAVGCRLGPTVLRTSTAGTVAAAILMTRSGRWS
jgi:16S rRNA (uracil1498-N3)-methyltransferase